MSELTRMSSPFKEKVYKYRNITVSLKVLDSNLIIA